MERPGRPPFKQNESCKKHQLKNLLPRRVADGTNPTALTSVGLEEAQQRTNHRMSDKNCAHGLACLRRIQIAERNAAKREQAGTGRLLTRCEVKCSGLNRTESGVLATATAVAVGGFDVQARPLARAAGMSRIAVCPPNQGNSNHHTTTALGDGMK